ncbi:hypothetical protein [Saccharothrix yanglingensis]|uniref:ApeA N-terminal domain-containing protein n=1 Tax=Saccharothrix yanglingensis TaxID=659496 RepID=A0ABU0X2Z0_9PSEU|nr:hypothetical protein [Saccharothrix yanglingensis]MDQ2586501.1 hypothetical protein [Saccharothrix yanglingensis]
MLDPNAGLVRDARAAVARSDVDGVRPLGPLRDAVSGVDGVLARRFTEVREHPDDTADGVADEVACLLAALARDPSAVELDLARLDRWDAASVWRTLRPDVAPHRAALVVPGAGALEGLDAFDATAEQAPPRSARSLRWDSATQGPRAFVDATSAGGEVRAVDRRSAARKARRALVELLDQYTAGTRLSSPVVDARVLVNRVGAAGTEQWRPPVRTTPVARPLTRRELPDEVRRALRMAHVAAGAPAVASAPAWSALEACGLVRRHEPAAAPAVQALRRQVVGAYRTVHQSAAARLEQARRRVAEAERAERHRAAARRDPTGRAGSSAARAALGDLLPHLHPPAVHEVTGRRAAPAGPEVLAGRLRDRITRTSAVLDALHATRNPTPHSGPAGDEPVHAVGAVMLTDLALEVLGNWYAHASDPTTPPAEVIATLARRHHEILSRLTGGTRPARLDSDRLTSPGTTGVWRPRRPAVGNATVRRTSVVRGGPHCSVLFSASSRNGRRS